MFFEVRGVSKWSQNGSQNASKIKLRCGGPPGAPPGAIWDQEQSEPQEVQNEPQEAPNDPQEGQNEPQEGQSELREVPGGFRERFGKDFQGISKQRDATELLGSVAGLGALAPLEIRPLSL